MRLSLRYSVDYAFSEDNIVTKLHFTSGFMHKFLSMQHPSASIFV